MISIMFDLQREIGEERWLESYSEMTGNYCYVFNQITWDFDYTCNQMSDDG